MHRDNQSSILVITNEAGTVVEKRLFDAWGNVVAVQDGAGVALAKMMFFDRGYTGHEHLQGVGLINMNARLYDPKLHRFLQADDFVQDPNNTQNYNRYGYCVNNPLRYTDPSGNEFVILGSILLAAIVTGTAISVAVYIGTSLYFGTPITAGGIIGAAVMGAISGAVTCGIGDLAGGFANFYSKAAFQALSHGAFQGTMTAIQGGNFFAGFLAGALSSIASSAWGGGMSSETVGKVTTETMHKGLSGFLQLNNTAGTLFFGALAGGAGASLGGGNFWQGAVTGLVVAGLNHVGHGSKSKTEYTKRQFEKNKEGKVTSEKLVYFKDNKKEGLLFKQAMKEPLKTGVLSIYAHGNRYNVNYYASIGGVQNMLLNDSSMWQDFKTNGGILTIDLKSCNTGLMTNNLNISETLTYINKGLTIYAPAAYWQYDGTIQNNAGYN